MSEYMKLKEQLLNELAARLERHGLKYVKSRQAYIRRFPWGMWGVHLNFGSANAILAAIDIAIRFDEVENLLHELTDYLSPKEMRNTFTVGVELGNWYDGGWRHYKGHDKAEISATVGKMERDIVSEALPFLEKYSDLEEVYRLIAEETRESRLICAFNDKRAMVAIATAHVLGKSDEELRRLIDAKLDYLRDKKGADIDRVRKFADYVLSLRANDEPGEGG